MPPPLKVNLYVSLKVKTGNEHHRNFSEKKNFLKNKIHELIEKFFAKNFLKKIRWCSFLVSIFNG